MKTQARVVVIGGGVVGCSVLYHLTKLGWSDVVLLERSELTSGSTWHAAGGMHTHNSDPNIAKLQKYTIELYREIEEISGQSCSLHITGGLMLASTPERMDYLKSVRAKGRNFGMELELVSASEAKEIMPLIDEKHFLGALFEPTEGHIDPSGVTHAYAGAARKAGAQIYRQNRVTGLQQRPDGGWTVVTEKGDIIAEHVVNAGGLWAREVGRMVGLELPVLAMEHMYLLTEDMPEVAEFNKRTGKEIPHILDFDGQIYMRQERGGMLMGTYEKNGVPWSKHETPWDFDAELLPSDLDRIAPSLEVGFSHFPAFERTGIRKIINGPFTFSPDGNPLIGPVRGLNNYWLACAVMAGFSQGGGVGLALANWMVEGDPGFDVWGMDAARFGDWTTPQYTNEKVREFYSTRFMVAFPNEERPAGRPLKTTPLYERLKAANAVFGATYGLETALWFAPKGSQPAENATFKRSNAFEPVAQECRAVREHAGVMEISGFAKYLITGSGAEKWLDLMLAAKLPAKGSITLSPMLNEDGRLVGDFTVARTEAAEFHIFGSGIAEDHHMRWFEERLPEKDVELRALGLDLVGLSISGPQSRAILEQLTSEDISTPAFPFLNIRRMKLGNIPALVGRISFTGELGYEIWIEPKDQITLFDQILEAGQDLGVKPFGSRALNSLRLEKSFGSWATEYRPIYTPREAGLSRFIAAGKGNFIGRESYLKSDNEKGGCKLVTFSIEATDADAHGDEPIWFDDEVVGCVTSGGYGHCVDLSLALGYIPPALATETGQNVFAIEILGEKCPATLRPAPLIDPKGARMRN